MITTALTFRLAGAAEFLTLSVEMPDFLSALPMSHFPTACELTLAICRR
jgi:hypothetical protein